MPSRAKRATPPGVEGVAHVLPGVRSARAGNATGAKTDVTPQTINTEVTVSPVVNAAVNTDDCDCDPALLSEHAAHITRVSGLRDELELARTTEVNSAAAVQTLDAEISRLEHEMKSAAANLDFEKAAFLRDSLKTLRSRELGFTGLSAGR